MVVNRAVRHLTALLPALLIALPAPASGDSQRWYDVEIIVFSHEGDPGPETWPLEPERPATRHALPILPRPAADEGDGDGVAEGDGTDGLSSLDHIPFQALPADAFRLPRTSRRIFDSDDYRLLAHKAWRQPGLDRERALPIHFQGGLYWRETGPDGEPVLRIEPNLPRGEWTEELTYLPTEADNDGEAGDEGEPPELRPYATEGPPAPVIDGTIRIIQTRYLHAEVDLFYRDPSPDERMQAYYRPDLVLHDPSRADAVPDRFRIVDSRRMRSGEIHYIDHPLVGIIVFVNRYEFADMDGEDDAILDDSSPGESEDEDESVVTPGAGVIDR